MDKYWIREEGWAVQKLTTRVLYILESNPHPFCSFRGLKNQMRIIIACG